MNTSLLGSALSLLSDTPTEREIALAAAGSLATWKVLHPGDEINVEDLVRELEARCLVWVPSGQILEDSRGHHEWLQAAKPGLTFLFWERYEAFLERRLNWPRTVIRRLDEVTDDVLGRIEDPRRVGAWDRRGLVVGRVQSGKTSTYIGLITKAADAGYRLIIVFAGLHNSLRSQTQVRLDEGFLGFDTQRRLRKDSQTIRMGVGELPGFQLLTVHPLTSSADRGDFNLRVAQTLNVMPGGAEPVVLVVKKNKSILANVTQWATTLKQVEDPATGRKVVRDVPLLVIDDEADNASVNTAERAGDVSVDENGAIDEEVRPSTINGQIRALLAGFEKKAYVGYTATPFANILSRWNEQDGSHGEGLFPRSFIINLRPPSNYMGPVEVFGLSRDGDASAQKPLPLIRKVEDAETWLPTKHKKTADIEGLPSSLVRAVHTFVLAAATRAARGERSTHNSMLVHVTRFTAVQKQVVELLKDELDQLRRRLRYGDGDSDSAWGDLAKLWDDDLATTTRAMAPDAEIAWDEVRKFVLDVVTSTTVKEINGSAKDVLDYVENSETGLTVIAVGGDKLSRGLTLEGLTVSYFLRASRMYDTLMQMGRWFGYRPGYQDLCRLYTTPELIRWYAQVTEANEELTELFDEMVASGQTPETFGLRVRKSPDGLMVTAPSKMRYAKTIRVSFNDSTAETIMFRRDAIQSNLEVLSSFVVRLGDGFVPVNSKKRPTRIWSNVPAETVRSFLTRYRTHPDAVKADSLALGRFIEASNVNGELVNWTVALISVDNSDHDWSVAGLDIGLVEREGLSGAADRSNLAIRRIVNPSDETLDLSKDQRDRALKTTIESWRLAARGTREPTVPVGWAVREQRSRETALLLLYPLSVGTEEGHIGPVAGMAISFPKAASDVEVEYAANQVYWESEYGWENQP